MPYLRIGLVLALAASLPVIAEDASSVIKTLEKPYIQHGPMLGHVGSHDAHIWIKASQKATLSVAVWNDSDLKKGRTFKGPELGEDADFMGRVAATGLTPGTRYTYSVLLNGKPALPPPFPEFTTGPAEGQKGKLRFAFTSCFGREGFLAGGGWGDMAARNFDFLLMLGDNHYADTTDRAKQRAAYYDHRSNGGFKQLARRTPIYAIWDDHDYGPNDSDGTAAGKEISLETFKQFWANPTYGETDNPGVYFKFSRGDIDFFMLDGRYHRTPNKAADDGSKTMLGEKQLAWLKRELLASKATIKFLAHGSEWQSFGTKDSWNSFTRERDELYKFIEDNQISGVMLLSGDRHFTGAYQVKGKWIEVTAGPAGSKNFPTKNLPEMFLNFGEGKLFCVYDIDTSAAAPQVVLEIYRAGDGLIHKRALTWDEINGKTKIPPLPPSPAPAK